MAIEQAALFEKRQNLLKMWLLKKFGGLDALRNK